MVLYEKFKTYKPKLIAIGCFILYVLIICLGMHELTADIPNIIHIFLFIGSFLPASITTIYVIKNGIKINTIISSVVLATISLVMASTALTYILIFNNIKWLLPNFLLHWLPFALGCIIFKNPKIWNICWISVFGIYSILQHYIFKFRGSIFTFKDIANIRSALDVKSSYSFSIDFNVLYIIVLLGITIFYIVKTTYTSHSLKLRLATYIPIYLAILITTPIYLNSMYNYGINNLQIIFGQLPQGDTPPVIGNVLTLYYDTVYNKLEIPKDYSDEKAKNILNKYTSDNYDDNVTIIAILNESWADLARISDIKTSNDYLKYWHSLENTYKGYVTVSPYGGMTCNSEFEFLTGNSMYFLPDGIGIYSSYLNDTQSSNVSYMNDLGFETTAFTTCPKTLWNIENAYGYLGFKNSYFRDYFKKPDDSELIHSNNMSDEAFFNHFNELADKRDKSKSQFYFLTTMQNHSPYDTEPQKDELKLIEPYNNEAENYLNLVSKTDKAFYDLTEHYKNDSQKVVIVMFGDHYPHLDYYSTLYGKSTSNLSTEEFSKMRQTPFIVWSNFDMGEFSNKFEDNISLNYLMNDVFKISNVPLSPYQQFLEDVRKTYPIISGFGYKTNDVWYKKTFDYDDILYNYHLVEYYKIFSQ